MLKRPLAANSSARVKKLPRAVSFAELARARNVEGDEGHAKKLLREQAKAQVSEMSACGKVLDSMMLRLDMADDQPDALTELEWHFVRPAALLQKLCSLKKEIGDLLPRDSPAHLVFYMDECKPGNVLRPDKGRELACFYWTVREFPSWFRARDGGWLFFSTFPSKWIHRVPGGASHLFSRMLETFFEDQRGYLNFETGFPVSCSTGALLCRARMGLLVSDAKALKQLWLLTGENGTKPCFQCQNVVGRMPAENLVHHHYLVHVTNIDKTRFLYHTKSTAEAMVEGLAAVADNKKECKRLGQLCGLVYHPHGILWHPRLRSKVNHVEQTAYDWMHVIVTSGGVGQYQVNEFCKHVAAVGIGLRGLDDFASTFHMPKKHHALARNFFRERVNPEENSCLKCFAGELLVAVPILATLVRVLLQPQGILDDECSCLLQLARILDILCLQDRALGHVQELERAIRAHARGFASLYPACCKPKFHWMQHLAEHIERFQCNYSCFAPERKHRAVKEVAGHVLNDALQQNVVLRLAVDALADAAAADVTPFHFVSKPRAAPSAVPVMQHVLDQDVVATEVGGVVNTPSGQLSVGDLAPWLRTLTCHCVYLENLVARYCWQLA